MTVPGKSLPARISIRGVTSPRHAAHIVLASFRRLLALHVSIVQGGRIGRNARLLTGDALLLLLVALAAGDLA